MSSTMTTTSRMGELEDELARRRREEYEMQLFGLHSRTVVATINQKIKEKVDSQCSKLFSSLEKKYKPDAKGLQQLKSHIKQFRRTYLDNMKPHLSTIESIVNKSICVPDNILLEEDKCQTIQYTDEEFHNLEMKLESLQQQAKRVTIFNTALKAELEEAENIKESEALAKRLCSITEKGLSAKKIDNKTLHAMEKCKGLTESIDSLNPQTSKDIYNNVKMDESDLEQIFIDQ